MVRADYSVLPVKGLGVYLAALLAPAAFEGRSYLRCPIAALAFHQCYGDVEIPADVSMARRKEYLMRVTAIGVAIMAATSSNLDAQTISGRIACESCAVQSQVVADLRHEAIANVADVFTDALNRYWVMNHRDLPVVFDGEGRFVAVVGELGPGPQELDDPRAIWASADSIAVFNFGGKVIVYGSDLTYGRTASVPTGHLHESIVMNWPGEILVASILSGEPAGQPLHIVNVASNQATIVSSFGRDSAATNAPPYRNAHTLGLSPDAGYWSAPRAQHRFTKRGPDHRVQFVIRRRPDWFAEPSPLRVGGPETPPSPILVGIEEDDEGLLWTFSLVPAPTWRKAWARLSQTPGEVPVSMIEWEYLYHTKIEVLDPQTSELLAEHTLDRGLTSLLESRRGVFVITDDAGVPTVRVVRFRLTGR